MIGNILALTNSTSNENIEVDGLLKKGLYNGTASDLKEDIDKKVSQEAGKVCLLMIIPMKKSKRMRRMRISE